MSKLFFVAWREYVEDYRPVRYPPTENILGWWLIGCGSDKKEDYHKVCAYVTANNIDQAYYHILKNWPEFEIEHVESAKETNKVLRHSKFVLDDWMKVRINNIER